MGFSASILIVPFLRYVFTGGLGHMIFLVEMHLVQAKLKSIMNSYLCDLMPFILGLASSSC
jgi:hypothetical protein